MKKIYIGECEHLQNCHIEDKECLKRYIHIINPRTNEVECLIFCNDYLKLNSKKDIDNFTYKEYVVELIEVEVLKYLKIEKKYREPTKTLSNHYFNFYICNRPFINAEISFKELIEWYYDNPTHQMLELIKDELISFLDRLYYKKYKTKYNELIRMCNKLKLTNCISKEDKETILIELINETFKLIIKNQ